MKLKTLAVVTMAAGISASAFGQGVILQNAGTAGNAVYVVTGGVTNLFDGNNFNVGVNITGGINASSLSAVGLGSYSSLTDPKGYTGLGLGMFALGPTGQDYAIPGVAAGGTATIRLQMWYDGYNGIGVAGLYGSYAAAAGSPTGLTADVTFTQSTGNPPLLPSPTLTGMPNIYLAGAVPEPSTLALAGLGLASLLMYRRRK